MNLLTLTGCIVKEPESKETQGQHSLKVLILGSSIGQGQKKEDIFWNILLWGNRYDKILSYLRKGRMLTVVGTLYSKPRFYQKGEETALANMQVTAEMIHLLPEPKREENKVEVKEEYNDLPF